MIAFTNASWGAGVLAPGNLVFGMAIQLASQLFNLAIKYLELLKMVYALDVFIGLLSGLSGGGSHGVACNGSRVIWGWPGLRVGRCTGGKV